MVVEGWRFIQVVGAPLLRQVDKLQLASAKGNVKEAKARWSCWLFLSLSMLC